MQTAAGDHQLGQLVPWPDGPELMTRGREVLWDGGRARLLGRLHLCVLVALRAGLRGVPASAVTIAFDYKHAGGGLAHMQVRPLSHAMQGLQGLVPAADRVCVVALHHIVFKEDFNPGLPAELEQGRRRIPDLNVEKLLGGARLGAEIKGKPQQQRTGREARTNWHRAGERPPPEPHFGPVVRHLNFRAPFGVTSQGSGTRLAPQPVTPIRPEAGPAEAFLSFCQAVDPSLQELRFTYDQRRVVKAVGQQRNALKSGEKVQCEGAPLVVAAERGKLRLQPCQQLAKRSGDFLAETGGILAELGAQTTNRTPGARQRRPIVHGHLHESLQAAMRSRRRFAGLLHALRLRKPFSNDRRADRSLGLEVIVDVAQRYMGALCNVGQRDPSEPLRMRELRCRSDQTLPLVLSGFCHVRLRKSVDCPSRACSRYTELSMRNGGPHPRTNDRFKEPTMRSPTRSPRVKASTASITSGASSTL